MWCLGFLCEYVCQSFPVRQADLRVTVGKEGLFFCLNHIYYYYNIHIYICKLFKFFIIISLFFNERYEW